MQMDTTFLLSVYIIFQILVFTLISLAGFYIFFFAVAGLFFRQPSYPKIKRNRRIAVLIPGYKEDEVILEVANDALCQDYPRGFYDIVIIADSFKSETIDALATLPVKIVEVSFEKSTKSKALNKAMNVIGNEYDIAIILDADNLMAPDFLTKINASFENDFVAVQGHRTAKNLDTSLAVLDAISEEINNHIFRKGHRVVGLSSAIIGSGMAFRYDYFKQLMSTVDAVGGFDKEIELKMLKQQQTIEYLDDAYVYDEKVQKAEVFSNQRRRWLSAQLHYFRKDFLTSVVHLFTRFNVDFFDKAIQFIQPPRILLLGAVVIFSVLFITLNLVFSISIIFSVMWVVTFSMIFIALAFSVPATFHNLKTLKALNALPIGMFLMLLTLFRLKGANKKFIHTTHTATKSANFDKLR